MLILITKNQTMVFNEAYNELLANEGGYVFDPLDSGGETYKGISRKHWPKWSGWSEIDSLKPHPDFRSLISKSQDIDEKVRDFYKSNYWDKLKCDDMPHEIRLELFDTAVNISKNLAGKYLQRALNLHNRNGSDYPDIIVDGKVGNATVSAAKSCKNRNGLFTTLNVLQGNRYIQITEKNPKNERFYNGWINRRVST